MKEGQRRQKGRLKKEKEKEERTSSIRIQIFHIKRKKNFRKVITEAK